MIPTAIGTAKPEIDTAWRVGELVGFVAAAICLLVGVIIDEVFFALHFRKSASPQRMWRTVKPG